MRMHTHTQALLAAEQQLSAARAEAARRSEAAEAALAGARADVQQRTQAVAGVCVCVGMGVWVCGCVGVLF
jgi:hypothetical protein